ncbi:MAG: zinc ribbon domain-containing protein [Nitrospinaceae bacterium]
MPLYEYYCQDCQTHFTLLQSVSTNRLETVCEQCGQANVRPELSTCTTKVQGGSTSSARPATLDDYPNKNVFNLPRPRHISEL